MRRSRSEDARPLRVHLGCGTHIVPGWVNVDGSWNARLAAHPLFKKIVTGLGLIPRERREVSWDYSIVCHNVIRRLPFEDSTVNCIYSSHMLEHLYRDEARFLLRECHRVLLPGGALRVVVPDLQACVQKYMESKRQTRITPNASVCAADELNEDMGFRKSSRVKGSLVYRLYASFLDFHTHKWMYDAESLSLVFLEAGFSEVAKHDAFQSRIPGIEVIEQEGRVLGGHGICIEGIKE